MHNDEVFLSKLAEEPDDDTTRLVYADWLDEQGDALSAAKARFLRLSVSSPEPTGEPAREQELQQLAAALDTDWLAVVSRLPVENCLAKRRKGLMNLRFEFVCDRRWEDMAPTVDRGVRFCDACRQKVHYCDTITVARDHALKGRCVAVDLGVIRRDGDLVPRVVRLGRVSPAVLRREQELAKPDTVSAERERRKRAKKRGRGKTTG